MTKKSRFVKRATIVTVCARWSYNRPQNLSEFFLNFFIQMIKT